MDEKTASAEGGYGRAFNVVYLAMMALAGLAPEEMRPTALVLNLLAGGIGITPFRSILIERHARGKSLNATLLYFGRDENFAFREDLQRLARGRVRGAGPMSQRRQGPTLQRVHASSSSGMAGCRETLVKVEVPR